MSESASRRAAGVAPVLDGVRAGAGVGEPAGRPGSRAARGGTRRGPTVRPPALLLTVLLAALGSAAVAQESTLRLAPELGLPPERCVRVDARGWLGARRGGFGWLVVEVANGHEARHEVVVAARDPADGRRFEVRRRLELAPGERQRAVLAVPNLQSAVDVAVDLDGRVDGVLKSVVVPAGNAGAALLVGFDRDASAAWTRLAPFTRRPHSLRHVSRLVHEIECRGEDLPADWRALSAFDLVVLDGAASIDADAQRAVASHAESGGRVLVVGADRLRPGPLRELAARSAGPVTTLGFGAVGFLGPLDTDDALREWLNAGTHDVMPAIVDAVAGPAPGALHLPAHVPGIAGVPTNLFFLIIVVFVLVVGPINHSYFRRRGTPWAVLVTVPAAGFLVTAFILTWSLVSEGLGTQGVVTTVSLVDQRDHRAIGLATRTVFASVSPAKLTPAAESYVFSHAVLVADAFDASAPRLGIDADSGEIDGALVPSRQPTGLATISRGPCRERIRFRRGPDGTFELLDDGGLRVVREDDALVLHDFDGGWHALSPDGRLRSIDAATARRLVETVLAAALRDGNDESGKFTVSARDHLVPRVEALLADPGGYVARVELAPAFDDLGLSVEWSRAQHHVIGRLAREDVVE